MSEDNDVLRHAARALRETHSGDSTRSSFTRARVMRSLHENKKRKLSRTLVFGPLAAILVGGTAFAAATGQLPELLGRAEEWFVTAYAPSGQATAIPQPGRKASGQGSSDRSSGESVPSASSVETAEPVETAAPVDTTEAVPSALPVDEVEAPVRTASRRAPPTTSPRAAETALPSEPPPPEPELPREIARDPELAQFRRAHDLHFQGRANDAIAAYGEYLAAYPSGRFVPEARYNTALNLLKLGQHSRARSILQAFADGRYGGYRKEQARGLLDAMAAGGASSRE